MSVLAGLLQRAPERPDNECRHDGRPGHVESWFLRLNHPSRPLALWLKATILAPLAGEAVAESWLVWFDGERGTTFAHKQTLPLAQARFAQLAGGAAEVRTDALELSLGPEGSARGELRAPHGTAAFDLRWTRLAGAPGEPLSLYPLRLLREGPFPKSKLLTPFPWLVFRGSLRLGDEAVSLDGWQGMEGHNWGKEHALEYAWGQCLFPQDGAAPAAMVEAFTGRTRVAGRSSPRISALVVRRGEETFRFDRLLDLWRQEATLTRTRWTLRLRGPEGEVRLRMEAKERPIACLGYHNPDGRLSYCFNTKLADVLLEVRPGRGPAFSCRSPHGGALEFLRGEPDPLLPVL